MSINRVILMVMDSVGCGELPDANDFGDVGSNTLGHIIDTYGDINIPNMKKLGLYNLPCFSDRCDDGKITKEANPIGCYGMCKEQSRGKETLVGHWEIAGVVTETPLPTYPNGFPNEIIQEFIKQTGREVIGNKVASGTEIINELGDEHVKTGKVIIYTSADSVFQIAAHVDVVPIEELYDMCKKARKILTGKHAVSRVIARPFSGVSGNYVRTAQRHDFALNPPKNILDQMKEIGYDVCAVGKINDIFNNQGITDYVYTKNNMDGVDKTIEYMDKCKKGLIFTNLVDFDMLWGHRRDVDGYANGLCEFDLRLPEIMNKMKDDDILIITADHGCDPTFKGTDHTREYIPMLVYGKDIKNGVNLGIRETFSDIAQTISDIFGTSGFNHAKSFIDIIK